MDIGDARAAIQILCQCLEYAIKKKVDNNPNFWDGNDSNFTFSIYSLLSYYIGIEFLIHLPINIFYYYPY